MAPTANAAFLLKGKTVDSVLGFLPTEANHYLKTKPAKLATMRHNFENVCLIVCDEISMVGSSKLLKINYRLQDIVEGPRSKDYMGGISFIASGLLFLVKHDFIIVFQATFINCPQYGIVL